jgi:hypothetical protein
MAIKLTRGRKKPGMPHSQDGVLSDSDIHKVYAEQFNRVQGGSAAFNRKHGSEAHLDDVRAILKQMEVLFGWELRQARLLTPEERRKQSAARTVKRYCLQALKRFNAGEAATLDQAFGLKSTKNGTPA